MSRGMVLLMGFFLALLAACEVADEAPPPTPSSVQLPALAASPQPTSRPAAPAIPPNAKAIFFVGGVRTSPPSGALWMSDLSNSDRLQLTPDAVISAFAGTALSKSGSLLVYYATSDSDTARTLWRLDTESGGRVSLLHFDGPTFRPGQASVSPDGQYVAYAERSGLTMLDLATGERRRLLEGSADACEGQVSGRCVYYFLPQWSPDGRLLLVSRGFYEGGTVTVVDPFHEPPLELTKAQTGEGPFLAVWSPSSESLCAHGRYAATSGLYVAEAPDWVRRNLLPDYEQLSPNEIQPVERNVTSCGWPDSQHILFATIERNNLTPYVGSPPERHEMFLFDLAEGQARPVADLPGLPEGASTTSRPHLITGAGGDIILFQQIFYPGDESRAGRPELVDVETGARWPIMEEGDWVVAVVEG